jgi:Asp-tRNA(Asn)/Glu-tRNA(Gln) amidotransferase A subunit family amidase
MLPAAIGNQTGGSLIRPCSYNGIYGFKPTHGALNIGGMHPIAPSQDHLGLMAATLADVWLVAQQIAARAGGSGGHPGIRGDPDLPASVPPRRLVHLRTLGWRELDKASVRAFEALAERLRCAGARVESDVDSPQVAALETLLEDASTIANDIIMYEARWPLLAYLDAKPNCLGARVMERLARGIEMTPDDYRTALANRDRIRRKVAEVARDDAAFLTLSSSGPAPFGHADTGSRAFLSPWSMIGGPSLSLPLLSVDRMPLGVQLMGLPDTDAHLTGIANWIDNLITR